MGDHHTEEQEKSCPNVCNDNEHRYDTGFLKGHEVRHNRGHDKDQGQGRKRVRACNKDILEGAFTLKESGKTPVSNDPERTITVDAGTGEYIIYAIPARLGDVTFFVSGFEGGFEDSVEQTLTNTSGYQETYKVYRSTRASLGETTIEIKEV